MTFDSASPEMTEGLARGLSLFARPGFCLFLNGDLGSGKSTFARAFIKSLALGEDDFDVPSPSFTLVQTYEETRVGVSHIDLYRLSSPQEVEELGLTALAKSHVLLVEWPFAGIENSFADWLHLSFSGTGQQRLIAVSGSETGMASYKRNLEIVMFLQSQGAETQSRRFFEGDASSRRYEKVLWQGRDVILMDMPRKPDGPIVRDGKPYSAIARLAEGIESVVAINDQLEVYGYGAPTLHHVDLSLGFALIEDLGSSIFGVMMRSGADMTVPLHAAVEVLADMATRKWADHLSLRNGQIYQIPHYDFQAQLIEVDLLPSWFHPHIHKTSVPAETSASFAAIWLKLLALAVPAKPILVLRDYHSPNLLWCPDRHGFKKVGLIDTQDAVLGHPAYDLASLLQDARVDIAPEIADHLYQYYVSLRSQQGDFDADEFSQSFAILGAQRTTKILGIFARLNARDGKPQYLKHMPRVSRYLARSLQHPALADLKLWYDVYMPEALEVGRAS